MIEVELKTTEPATVAYVSMRGPYDQVPEAMGRLYGWIAQHGMRPVGMPMAVYYTAPDDGPEADAVWELQAPLAGEHAEQDADASGCGVRHLEPHLAASAMYKGPYEFIEPAYKELQTWIAANGYVLAGPPREVYYSDPSDTAPEDYLTEIVFPVDKH